MITSFKGTFLSNFAGGVEQQYQAAKTDDPVEKAEILAATPAEAKKRGRTCTLRHDWDAVETMTQLIRVKFARGSDYAKNLLETEGDLIEGNTWGDRIWGAVWNGESWVGENRLGKILMQRRHELNCCRVANHYKDAPTPLDVSIMRPSLLGNRWSHLKGNAIHVPTRDIAVDKYHIWLREQYQERGNVYQELMKLVDQARTRGIVLVCCCSPLRCHGDIIQRAIEGIIG